MATTNPPAPSTARCALPQCNKLLRATPIRDIRSCKGGCQNTFYCNRRHSQLDYRRHLPNCISPANANVPPGNPAPLPNMPPVHAPSAPALPSYTIEYRHLSGGVGYFIYNDRWFVWDPLRVLGSCYGFHTVEPVRLLARAPAPMVEPEYVPGQEFGMDVSSGLVTAPAVVLSAHDQVSEGDGGDKQDGAEDGDSGGEDGVEEEVEGGGEGVGGGLCRLCGLPLDTIRGNELSGIGTSAFLASLDIMTVYKLTWKQILAMDCKLPDSTLQLGMTWSE